MQVGIYYRTPFSSAGKDGKIKKSRITLGIRFAVALAYHAFVYAKCRYLTISFFLGGSIRSKPIKFSPLVKLKIMSHPYWLIMCYINMLVRLMIPHCTEIVLTRVNLC